MRNQWYGPLITAQGDGAALSNSAVATSLLPAAAKYVLASNMLAIGDKLRIKAHGRISTHSAPGTLTLDVRFGSTVVFNGGASPTLAASQTNVAWDLEIDLTCRVIGASAQLIGQGRLITAGLSALIQLLPASAPAVGTAFDSVAAQTVDLFATCSVANAANSITLHQYELISCT